MERHLNRKLAKAIEENWPLFWGYGEYRKYYTGLTLRACTGHSENGKVYTHVVFGTTSLAGAQEVKAVLESKGIAVDMGWKEALRKLEDHR